MPGGVDTVLFDLDGTLADTAPDLLAALNAALAEAGGAPISMEALRAVVSDGARAMVERAAPEGAGDGRKEQIRQRFLTLYAGDAASRSDLFPGVPAMLEHLEQRGIRWGVVTNKIARFAEPLLRALLPDGRLGCLVCGDSTRHAKPHPEPLLRACQELSSRPWRCVYVGDAERDVLAGRRAGMRTVVAAYGYLGPADRPDAWGADGIIERPAALVPWLDRAR